MSCDARSRGMTATEASRVLGCITALAFLGCGGEPEQRSADPSATQAAGSGPGVRANPHAVEADASPPGRWKTFKPRPGSSHRAAISAEEIERLEAMGYLAGTNPAHENTGLLVHERDSAFQGINFYVSGHAPEALLLDMDGEVLHKWGISAFDVWPDYRPARGVDVPNHWRRAYLYPNGDVTAIYGGLGIVKIDKDSKVHWAYRAEHVHHDLEVLADGTIYTLTRKGTHAPELNPRQQVVLDYIIALDGSTGEVLREWSVFDSILDSPYRPLVQRMRRRGDVLHTNTIEVLDGRHAAHHPAFAKGNFLISILNLDAIAIIDPRKESVVWALLGLWSHQHQPVFLDDGRMLIFDNRGLGKRSRVLEFDPLTKEVFWLHGEEDSEFFHTALLGSVQRLPNGNTLITESDNGRAFEVTPEHRIVWEFVTPHRTGNDDELIASLYELVRLAPDFPRDWVNAETIDLAVDVTRRDGPTRQPIP